MKTILSAVAACIAIAAAPATAATFNDLSGNIAEGPNLTYPGDIGYTFPAANELNDFSDAVGDPTLDFADDAWIFGRVYTTYIDGFTIDASDYTFDLVVGATKSHNGGILTYNIVGSGLNESGSLGVGDTALTFGNLTGDVEIALSVFSQNAGTASVEWLVDVMDVTDVAPVPLPASSLLLLAGLGGLGAMRRRKKS